MTEDMSRDRHVSSRSHLRFPANSVTIRHVTERDKARREAETKRRARLLTDALKTSGLSQTAFAERSRTDRSAVNQMLAGNKPFGSTVAARFTKALGLPDDYFEPPTLEQEQAADADWRMLLLERLGAIATTLEENQAMTAEILRLSRDDPEPNPKDAEKPRRRPAT